MWLVELIDEKRLVVDAATDGVEQGGTGSVMGKLLDRLMKKWGK